MKMIAVTVVALIAALAAAGFAWQRSQALEQVKVELASASAELQKARSETQALKAEAVALRKEAAEQKAATEQLRTEVNSAKAFLDAERLSSARLREELVKAKEQLAAMAKARSVQSVPPPMAVPMLVRPPPAAVAPGQRGTAIGVGVPAK
jgi:septal ring factor EnvC (AmiA/AmiB activator)